MPNDPPDDTSAGLADDADDAVALLYAAAAARQAEADAMFQEYDDALAALRAARAVAAEAAAEPITVASVLAAGGVGSILDEAMTGDWTILAAPDVVDGDDALRLVQSAVAAPADVLLDLRGTSILTAEGARALYDIHRYAQMTGNLAALLGPTRLVRTVLDVSGLTDRMSILPEPRDQGAVDG